MKRFAMILVLELAALSAGICAGTALHHVKAKGRALTAEAATGTVCGSSPHCVVLSWSASSDGAANPTLGYNLYRSATSGGEGGTPLNGSALSSVNCPASGPCTFTDTSVTVGQKLFYVVRASLNGGESANSPEAAAIIPPAAPTGLTETQQ